MSIKYPLPVILIRSVPRFNYLIQRFFINHFVLWCLLFWKNKYINIIAKNVTKI
jgi:hypothetical protein